MASVDATDTAAVATTSPKTESELCAVATTESEARKWPGWPGDTVYRLIVPVLKVGSIIGRKGDAIKKLCEETRARVRVLDGPVASPDRIVCHFLLVLGFRFTRPESFILLSKIHSI